MSRGKYSPTVYRVEREHFIYNCYGKMPAPWDSVNYDEKTMFGNYDSEGYDSYGYSAFDEHGNYVGIGDGVDRAGYTELDYLTMSDDDFLNI